MRDKKESCRQRSATRTGRCSTWGSPATIRATRLRNWNAVYIRQQLRRSFRTASTERLDSKVHSRHNLPTPSHASRSAMRILEVSKQLSLLRAVAPIHRLSIAGCLPFDWLGPVHRELRRLPASVEYAHARCGVRMRLIAILTFSPACIAHLTPHR